MLPILRTLLPTIIKDVLIPAITSVASSPEMPADMAKGVAHTVTENVTRQVVEAVKADPALKPKAAWKSKTLIYGIGSAVLVPVLTYLAGVDLGEYGLGFYAATIANGVIVIALRLITTKPVGA